MSIPTVSVIIPVFNRSTVLDRSVGSALRQTGIAVEVIAIDDGSCDASVAMLEALAAAYPDTVLVILRHSENLGQAVARNTGMAIATGRYMAFLDSDDAFGSVHTLAQWIAQAERLDAEILVARSAEVLANDTQKAAPLWRLTNSADAPYTPLAVSTTPDVVAVRNFWQCLYLKSFLDGNAVTFSPRLKQREDRLFMLQSFFAADRIFFTNQITHLRYRDQENSTMNDRSIEQLEMFIQHIHELALTVQVMRRADRSNPDFEMINAFQYYKSCTQYWRATLLRCFRRGRRDLVLRLAQGLTLLADGLPEFASHPRFDASESARVDLVRLVLAHEKLGLFKMLLKKKEPDADQLEGLCVTHKQVVQRYLNSTRIEDPSNRRPSPDGAGL